MKKVIILFLALALVGCKSKQKAVERVKVVEELEATHEIEETTADALELAGSSIKKTEIEDFTDTNTVEIEADSTGTVTRRVEKTENGIIETFTGVKKVVVTNEKKETTKTENSQEEINLKRELEQSKKESSTIKINNETNTRKTQVEISSTSTWFWVLLFIFVVLVAYWNRQKIRSWFT